MANQDTTRPSQPKPSIPWRTRLSLALLKAVSNYCNRPDGTVNRGFLRFLDFPVRPNAKPVNGVSTVDVTVDSGRNLWFRLFSPSSAAGSSSPVLVFFHGGGFIHLNPSSPAYDAACRRFARKLSAYVVSINYRLAPEHRYPAQYDDGFDVLQFLDENYVTLLPETADISKCFLVGDSAGGNIAHHTAVRASEFGFRTLKIVGLVNIQPFFGGEERTESEKQLVDMPIVSVPGTDWCWKALLPTGSNRDHEAVNVCGPNAKDLSRVDFPDTLLVVAGFDPLKDWQRRYFAWLKKSDKTVELIEYPNSFHAFYIFPEVPESKQLIMQVKDFVAKRLSGL